MLRLFCYSIYAVVVCGFIMVGCGGTDSSSSSDDTGENATDTANKNASTDGSNTTSTGTGLTTTTTTLRETCGDGVKSTTEECDRADFGGETCASFITDSYGSLSCNSDCTIDESMCRSEDISDSGYGSGGDN
jgi:hypothetical protein